MQNARCALADKDGDALTGRRLLARPGARFDYPKHGRARFVGQRSEHTEL